MVERATRSMSHRGRVLCASLTLAVVVLAPPKVRAQEVAAPAAPPRSGPGLLNPDISVIADFYAGYYGIEGGSFAGTGVATAGDDPAPAQEGFGVQEIELAISAPIDPYFDGALFLAIPNLEGIEVEEAYLVTTALPWNLQLKGGIFRSQLGRNNGQHLHQQHFTRRPLMTAAMFGADGLRAPGLQLSILLPTPWFAGLYLEGLGVTAPEDRAPLTTFGGGGRGTPDNLTYAAALKQFWSPVDSTGIFLSLDAATGKAVSCPADETIPCDSPGRSFLYGATLFLKWRPLDALGERVSLQSTTELFLRSVRDGRPAEGALYSEAILQFARRWYVGGRIDVLGLPSGPTLPRTYGAAASLTFAPTEFSRLRLYGQELFGPAFPSALVVFLQAEFSIGAHGAHPY